ncbi:hypothetical protein BpHYR1_008514 [Brachionus plicatilis]|uniref:Uncharacterized protein n=1 Tax=Brachionus plicatilis TaxID=10195 RepID=A0A3M7T4T6_BRAPC|nr:hypothetical protein BpHYR1_008514 [Brachionus plicatilis]
MNEYYFFCEKDSVYLINEDDETIDIKNNEISKETIQINLKSLNWNIIFNILKFNPEQISLNENKEIILKQRLYWHNSLIFDGPLENTANIKLVKQFANDCQRENFYKIKRGIDI